MKPITHGGVNRAYQVCKCSECGIEQECTPHFDFYVRHGQPDDGPLVCETCLIGKRPLIYIGENPNN